MRQIKFRAWDKKDKKYLYSEKQEFICTTHSNGLGVTIPFDIDEKYGPDVEGIDWADADLIIGRYELEQFTGLYDKNGQEIYEGDLVKWKWKHTVSDIKESKEYTESVYWVERDASFAVGFWVEPLGHLLEEGIVEVVGNIHETNMEDILNEFD